MIRINNADLKRAFSDSTKTQLSEQPNLIDNSKVTPVIDVTPLNHKTLDFGIAVSADNAVAATLFTSSANADTYLTSGTLGWIKDATSTSTLATIRAVVNGGTFILAAIPGITLTANAQTISFVLPYPVKIDRNTAVTLTSSTNVANIKITGVIHGYIVNPL